MAVYAIAVRLVMPFTVPNLLTWLRILLIPVFAAIFYLPQTVISGQGANVAAAAIFAVAALTDWLDGYLARALNQTSAFGAFLDPVADKLIVAAALILLIKLDRVDAVIAMIIIGREIALSALREWMAGVGRSRSMTVAFVGKLKTAAQMVAIWLLLYYEPIGIIPTSLVGTWLIYIAAVLTLWSMAYYVIRAKGLHWNVEQP